MFDRILIAVSDESMTEKWDDRWGEGHEHWLWLTIEKLERLSVAVFLGIPWYLKVKYPPSKTALFEVCRISLGQTFTVHFQHHSIILLQYLFIMKLFYILLALLDTTLAAFRWRLDSKSCCTYDTLKSLTAQLRWLKCVMWASSNTL